MFQGYCLFFNFSFLYVVRSVYVFAAYEIAILLRNGIVNGKISSANYDNVGYENLFKGEEEEEFAADIGEDDE